MPESHFNFVLVVQTKSLPRDGKTSSGPSNTFLSAELSGEEFRVPKIGEYWQPVWWDRPFRIKTLVFSERHCLLYVLCDQEVFWSPEAYNRFCSAATEAWNYVEKPPECLQTII